MKLATLPQRGTLRPASLYGLRLTGLLRCAGPCAWRPPGAGNVSWARRPNGSAPRG